MEDIYILIFSKPSLLGFGIFIIWFVKRIVEPRATAIKHRDTQLPRQTPEPTNTEKAKKVSRELEELKHCLNKQ